MKPISCSFPTHTAALGALLLFGLAGCGSATAAPSPTARAAASGSPAANPAAALVCTAAKPQPDAGRDHLSDPNHTYPVHPATSGPHSPIPLPPQPAVYSTEVAEARAVHNLEHGYVVVYYQSGGPDALPAPVLEALRSAVTAERRTLLAPYPALPPGRSLALTAWTVLQECPRQVTIGEVRTVLAEFILKHRDSSTAPEPGAR